EVEGSRCATFKVTSPGSLGFARDDLYSLGGVAPGEPVMEGLGDALGVGEAAAFAKGNFSAVKSGLLITNVPSRSSVLANHIASSVCLPMVNLCCALSSGELVKLMTNCGVSKACSGFVAPAQRTARSEERVLTNDS